MQIVINIDDNIYHRFVNGFANDDDAYLIEQLFKNGTPLPKGHGRLIDVDALNRKDVNCANVPMNFIDTAPTIIEADK